LFDLDKLFKGELQGFPNLNFNIYLRTVPFRKQREREMDMMRMARQQALEEEERVQVFQGFKPTRERRSS